MGARTNVLWTGNNIKQDEAMDISEFLLCICREACLEKTVALERHCNLIFVAWSFITVSERNEESQSLYTAEKSDLEAWDLRPCLCVHSVFFSTVNKTVKQNNKHEDLLSNTIVTVAKPDWAELQSGN